MKKTSRENGGESVYYYPQEDPRIPSKLKYLVMIETPLETCPVRILWFICMLCIIYSSV